MKSKNHKAELLKQISRGTTSIDSLEEPKLSLLVGYEDYHKFYVNEKPVSESKFLQAQELVFREIGVKKENPIKITYGHDGVPSFPFAVKKSDLQSFTDQHY